MVVVQTMMDFALRLRAIHTVILYYSVSKQYHPGTITRRVTSRVNTQIK
jgi:hypothetical protein